MAVRMLCLSLIHISKEVRALREAGIQVYVADKEEFDGLKALSGAGKEEE